MPAPAQSAAASGTAVLLPTGLWLDGERRCEAALRSLSGLEEEAAGDASAWPSAAARVTGLLAIAVTRIGGLAPITAEHVRGLTLLDRDVLLMALRQRLFGDRVRSTVNCPACGMKVDLDFRLSDLPIPDRTHDLPCYTFDAGGMNVTYRLPNGGDQEAAALWVEADPARAERIILERCVEHLDRLTEDQVAALSEEMAARDPQLVDEFDSHCPECGADFQVRFDIQDFVLQELSQASEQLYRHIHTLAWYYHWSEAEILAMPLARRRRYLDLVADAVDQLQEAGL